MAAWLQLDVRLENQDSSRHTSSSIFHQNLSLLNIHKTLMDILDNGILLPPLHLLLLLGDLIVQSGVFLHHLNEIIDDLSGANLPRLSLILQDLFDGSNGTDASEEWIVGKERGGTVLPFGVVDKTAVSLRDFDFRILEIEKVACFCIPSPKGWEIRG